jgi:hypothetical protein
MGLVYSDVGGISSQWSGEMYEAFRSVTNLLVHLGMCV